VRGQRVEVAFDGENLRVQSADLLLELHVFLLQGTKILRGAVDPGSFLLKDLVSVSFLLSLVRELVLEPFDLHLELGGHSFGQVLLCSQLGQALVDVDGFPLLLGVLRVEVFELFDVLVTLHVGSLRV